MNNEQLYILANALLNEAQEQNRQSPTSVPPEVFAARMAASLVMSGLAGALLAAIRNGEKSPRSPR